jgi:uncharacterized lipoprotein YmbA
MTCHLRFCLLAWLLLLQMLLPACSTFKPVKDLATHHLLEPLVPDRALPAATPKWAINRPSIPVYLDRMPLVTRRDGQLMMSQLDLWGEPLDVGITRVLASNLSRLTGSAHIRPIAHFSTMDYSALLEMHITEFEPDAANQMILQGTWRLQSVTGTETSSRYFRIAVPLPTIAEPGSMKARVTAMNEALEQLAREVAKSH